MQTLSFPSFQCKKTYCAVFCASPVALLAGSSNNTSYNGLQWLERVADCTKVREDIVRPLIYTISCWASMKFFRHFTVKKTTLPCLLKGSLAYIFSGLLINKKSVKRVCGKIVFVTKFLVYRGGIKGSGTLLMSILSEKRLILHEKITPAFHYFSDEKMLLLTGKIEKAYI